jgi:hypothetical protein
LAQGAFRTIDSMHEVRRNLLHWMAQTASSFLNMSQCIGRCACIQH